MIRVHWSGRCCRKAGLSETRFSCIKERTSNTIASFPSSLDEDTEETKEGTRQEPNTLAQSGTVTHLPQPSFGVCCEQPNIADCFAPHKITPRACVAGDNDSSGWSAHTVWHLKCRTTSRMSKSSGMVRGFCAAVTPPSKTDMLRRARRYCVYTMPGRRDYR